MPIQLYLYPNEMGQQRNSQQTALTEEDGNKTLSETTSNPPKAVASQGPLNPEPSWSGNQTVPFQLYPIMTDNQRKYKQMALAKEAENKTVFESFLRTMKNMNSVPEGKKNHSIHVPDLADLPLPRDRRIRKSIWKILRSVSTH